MNMKTATNSKQLGVPLYITNGRKPNVTVIGALTKCKSKSCHNSMYIDLPVLTAPLSYEQENDVYRAVHFRLMEQRWCFIQADAGWCCALCMKS